MNKLSEQFSKKLDGKFEIPLQVVTVLSNNTIIIKNLFSLLLKRKQGEGLYFQQIKILQKLCSASPFFSNKSCGQGK